MKKLILIILCFVSTTTLFAQKFASVDTEYILSNMPEYKQAQKELDDMAVQWQKEVEAKFQIVDRLYKAFQAESVLLPEELKTKKENEIIAAEKEAKDMQKQRFGNTGDLSKKRSVLVKPIQDKVFSAIEEYAKEKGYAFVFDVSGSMTIVYADNKFDINDAILEKLGITPTK